MENFSTSRQNDKSRYAVVRLDTQVKNTGPFNIYLNLGYKLAGICHTMFQNLTDNVELAMFEKKL